MKTRDGPFPFSLHRIQVQQISKLLREVAYNEVGTQQVLGVEELPINLQHWLTLPLYVWRARGGRPLEHSRPVIFVAAIDRLR